MDVIFDLDGTLADLSHRLHYAKKGPTKNWKTFFAKCGEDTPIQDVIDIYLMLERSGYKCYIVSGRSDEVIQETWDWLDKHSLYPFKVIMRKQGDYREDSIVKQEMLNEHWPGDRKKDIFAVFDDRDRVVEMWRANGLRCYQVASGDF